MPKKLIQLFLTIKPDPTLELTNELNIDLVKSLSNRWPFLDHRPKQNHILGGTDWAWWAEPNVMQCVTR